MAPVVLAVTATGREAEDLTEALRAFLPADTVAEFPSWETLPHERLSPRSDTVGRRLSVLRRLAHPETSAGGALRVVVAPVRAVVQPIVAGLGELVPVTLKVGQDAPFGDVVKKPRRRRLRPRGHGHPARRIRRPRRDAGCLPAHRGPPHPGRVLW